MTKTKKKIGIILLFLSITLLGMQPISQAGWASTSPSFIRSETFSNYGWSGNTYKRPSGTNLKISSSVSITKVANYSERRFSPNPTLDTKKFNGVLCLQHEKNSGSKGATKVRSNIIVNGTNITRDYGTSKSKNLGDKSAAARIAYILTNTSEIAGSSKRKNNGTQGAMWKNCVDYYKTFTSESVSSSFATAVNTKGSDYYKWANVKNAKTIQKESKEYEAMIKNVQSVKFTTSNYSQFKSVGNNYVIGPFRATFTSYTTGGTTYAGQYHSSFNGKTSGWSFCNANGTTIKPTSGANFYISVPKTWCGTGRNFTFKARRLNVRAEWWEKENSSGSQDHLYLTYAYRHYLEESAAITVTPPSLKIIKTDANTKKPLQGMQFKIKNASGYYLTSMPSNSLAVFGSTNASQAMTFTTDKNGQFTIPRIETGTYTIIETGVGNNWQYEAKGEMGKATVNKAGVTTVSLTNKKAFISLSRICMGRYQLGSW